MLKKLFWTLCLFLLPIILVSKPITWQKKNKSLQISQSARVFEDATCGLTINDILSNGYQSQFTEPNKNILSFGITESCYWIGLEIINPTDEELVLELAQYGLPVCDFYLEKPDGSWKVEKAGYTIPLDDRIWSNHFQVFPLQKGLNKVYLKVQSFSPPIPINVWEQGAFSFKSLKLKMAYGIYLGILAFVILINLFLFFSLGNHTYLHYSLLVSMHILIASTVMDGFAMYLISGINLKITYILIPAITMLVTMSYGLLFLEVKKYSQRINQIGWAWIAYVSLIIVSQFFIPYLAAVIINQINAIIGLFLTMYLGIFVARKGNRVGYYFAAAYALYLVITIFEIFFIQTGKPQYIFGISYVAFAIFMEVILLAYALTKRFQWERKANIDTILNAKTQLVEKTKENERIVKEQNIILEKRVSERTIELNETNNLLYSTLKTVELEKAKSDALLLNILPKSTAEELKENGFAQPRDFKNVSILFTDFIDFTSTTNSLSPTRLVEDLNECFKAFDSIVKKLNLEKIKTIGDAYMAASGLPDERNDHAIVAVRCAMQMMEFISAWQKKRLDHGHEIWKIRMGIHSGSVVAGVVGDHKFAYDIWGDAVNTASRMESNSNEGKINISAATHELVKDYFQCTPRGKFFVKGKGEMEMFWVEKEFQLV